jgi:hypothetical protein
MPQGESFLGRVPREWSAGEQPQRGEITKPGKGRMWALVGGAAGQMARSQGRWVAHGGVEPSVSPAAVARA